VDHKTHERASGSKFDDSTPHRYRPEVGAIGISTSRCRPPTFSRFSVLGAVAIAVACLGSSVALAGPPKSARPVAGGYYTGKSVKHKPATADVSPDAKQVSAASFTLSCGGQNTQGAMQHMKIHKSHGSYSFSGTGSEALLFTSSSLSEIGQVSFSGKFVRHHKIKGTFRVKSPTCGDSGKIAYTLKLKTA
jgi:hypothetical protein